ncbi:hypothetical protein ACTL6P_22600 [Endozoicomonas acroporae]|uniref:hypothetical protein n=1 Tax=Endozoicomonas acroporae TaxID=1701104 RepID=UPI000C76ECE4|nr:hypothetical protein [Endozoicomonas acroporae]
MLDMNPPLVTKFSVGVSDSTAPSARLAEIRKEVTAFFRQCCLADVPGSGYCQTKTHQHQCDLSAFTNWDHFVPAPVSATLFHFHQRGGGSGSRTITIEPPRNRTLILRPPVLRLRDASAPGSVLSPPSARPEHSLPVAGAVGGSRAAELPSGRIFLLDEVKKRAIELEQVADQLTKVDKGSSTVAQLEARQKQINDQINAIKSVYQQRYGMELIKQFVQWQAAVRSALCKEASTSPQTFDQLQNQIGVHLDEIELFLIKDYHDECNNLLQQLHKAKTAKEVNDRANFVRDLINANNSVLPNQLQGGDDDHLYGYFDELREQLASLQCILKMPDISAADQQKTRQNIIIITAKVERIAESFAAISRYDRLRDSSHLYPGQLAEMQQTIRKGKRLSSTTPSPQDQERRALVAKLKQDHPEVTIDEDAILDMAEEDFQLVLALLGKQTLTKAQQQTLQRNDWQQTDRNNLVVNRGNERVRLHIYEDRYQLVDNITGDIIGSLTPDRWERIKQRLKDERKSLSEVTHQMIVDDFVKFPTSPYQYQWCHDVHGD